jgi:hypothetical protein
MKTVLDLPDELAREIKIRAVTENRKLKDAVAGGHRMVTTDVAFQQFRGLDLEFLGQ